MHELRTALKSTPIVYITRDLERAIGLSDEYKNYYIVSNWSPWAKEYSKGKKNILLIKEKNILDTQELLEHKKTLQLLKKLKNFSILIFKNTSQIEKICHEHSWNLLNPNAELANRIEEKISQIEWLGPLKKYLPPHKVMLCKNLQWNKEKFILQFNRAHTGSGTILIESEKQIQELKQKFPNREVRVTQFIDGSAFTVNSVVWGNKVLVGNISYQITGLPPFTDQKFATIGNDWALPQRVLNSKQIKQFKQMATDIGKKLAKDGWKGLFGIDVIMDEKTRKLYLIEINARQPASTTYESQLQTHNTYHVTRNSKLMTTFEAHLAALLKLHDTGYVLREISSGSQIIQRVTSSTYKLPPTSYKLRKHFTLIPYPNTDPGKDLLRIQSKKGIMASHNEFNKTGEEIVSTLVTRPAWLNKIDPSFRWDSKKIWKLNLPTQQMDIKKLTWHLDLPFWEKEGTDDWNLTPREVIKNPEQQPTHYKKIINSDLRYPIAIMKLKGQWRVLDGLHRLAKAHMDGKKKMLVKIIDKRHAPSIAFDN